MKIILLEDVDNLGEEGDIVDVKNGYGRNYLIPRGLALIATPGVVKARQEERRQQARKRAQMKDDAATLKQQLEKEEVVVEVKVGEENRIFGTVTPQQVALKLALEGYHVDRRNITLTEEIRVIGVYTAQIKLYTDVVADVKVRVVPEGGLDAVEAVAEAETDAEAEAEAEADA